MSRATVPRRMRAARRRRPGNYARQIAAMNLAAARCQSRIGWKVADAMRGVVGRPS